MAGDRFNERRYCVLLLRAGKKGPCPIPPLDSGVIWGKCHQLLVLMGPKGMVALPRVL